MKKIKLLISALSLTLCGGALACTTWASIGNVSANHGLLLAKNRDGSPSSYELLRIEHPKHGYKYLILAYNVHKAKSLPYISAGVNEQGVVVVNNAADTQKMQQRDQGETRTMRRILMHYSSVKQVIADQKKLFTTSLINDLLIGDKHDLILVEMGRGGQYKLWHKKNGVLFHTNTYESKKLAPQNHRDLVDSDVRYQRIKTLLARAHTPYTFEYFLTISNDQMNPTINNNIFRPWTMATWVIGIPKHGMPKLYVRFTNPSEAYNVFRLNLDKHFWQQLGSVKSWYQHAH